MFENVSTSHGVDRSTVASVELTDGWYSVNAVPDAPLSKKMASGKLSVGQKIKVFQLIYFLSNTEVIRFMNFLSADFH